MRKASGSVGSVQVKRQRPLQKLVLLGPPEASPEISGCSVTQGLKPSPCPQGVYPPAAFHQPLGLTPGSRPWPGPWALGFRSSLQLPTSCPPCACSPPRARCLAPCCHVSRSLASRRCRPSSLPLGVPQDGGGRQRTLWVPLNQRVSSIGPKRACFINCRELCKPKAVVVGESSRVLWHK